MRHTGYYRKFVRHYSNMTYPLEELLKENQEYEWTEECDASFDTLKKILVESHVLQFPNWSIKLYVHIDASGIEIDALLTQRGDDGMDYPIVYISRNTYSQISKLVSQISCTRRCIKLRNWCNIDTTRRGWDGLPNCVQ